MTTVVASDALSDRTDYHSPRSRSLTAPITWAKSDGNPILVPTDTAFGALSWPWVLRVADLLASPLDDYYMWYSTDHAQAAGAIGLATAPTPLGPWTDRGQVYEDTSSGTESETPSVIWNEATSEFWMYYQQANAAEATATQATLLAKSADGQTFTRYGVVADLAVGWIASHTGYFRPFRLGDRWFAYSLLKGGQWPLYGLWYSTDGLDWTLDPRPLGPCREWVDPALHLTWNDAAVFTYRGRLWLLSTVAAHSSGVESRAVYPCVAPLADDLRSITGPPVQLFAATQAWETEYTSNPYVMIDFDGRVYLFYRSNLPGQFGVAELEVG